MNSSIQLIETRVVFGKELTGNQETDSFPIAIRIKEFGGNLNSELESLAFQSGTFSRFNVDTRLIAGEFEKLYKLWIQKSVEEKEVLVADDKAGFVSFNVTEDTAQIGLIAVDKYQRDKGIGKRLIHAAEAFAFAKGAKKMKIGTQEANHPACALYSKLGYEVVERVGVWHYWKERDL